MLLYRASLPLSRRTLTYATGVVRRHRETLRKLRQDHSMIEYLLVGLQDAVTRAAPPPELDRHMEGLAALMESHFRYEERQLLSVLETLALDADPDIVLGPL